jgi:2-polyprenyl-3-methyl-5-hydroxy-6-metoxy-1,4-benzoquinol methylase
MNNKSTEEKAFFANILTPHEVSFDDFHEHRTSGIVVPWAVRRRDIYYMSRFFQEIRSSYILDIECGSGFLGWLLAMEGLPVTGMDTSEKVELSVFRHSLFAFIKNDISKLENNGLFDGVVLSWPSSVENSAQAVKMLNPRGIVFVVEMTGGTSGNKTGQIMKELLEVYRPVAYWDNVCHKDINSTLFRIVSGGSSGMLAPEVFKTSHNRVILLSHRELQHSIIADNLKKSESVNVNGYPWEKDLDKYYRVGEYVDGNRKVLWQIKRVSSESEFLRNMSYSGIIERGLVI